MSSQHQGAAASAPWPCASSRRGSGRWSASSAASRCGGFTNAFSVCWRWRVNRWIRGCRCASNWSPSGGLLKRVEPSGSNPHWRPPRAIAWRRHFGSRWGGGSVRVRRDCHRGDPRCGTLLSESAFSESEHSGEEFGRLSWHLGMPRTDVCRQPGGRPARNSGIPGGRTGFGAHHPHPRGKRPPFQQRLGDCRR